MRIVMENGGLHEVFDMRRPLDRVSGYILQGIVSARKANLCKLTAHVFFVYTEKLERICAIRTLMVYIILPRNSRE